MQIDAPDFDPDIDRPVLQRAHHNTAVVSVQDLLTSPKPESIDATNTQEETTDNHQFNLGHSHSKDSHRSGHNSLDEIPPLKEHWQNGQFKDADTKTIDKHNSHSESE